MNFCVLGAGAWGTAMAIHLSRIGHPVTLVARRMEHALQLASQRENQDYLPGIAFGADLQIAGELKSVMMEAEAILVACPSKTLDTQCEHIWTSLGSAQRLKLLISLCKGLEPKQLLRPTQILRKRLPGYSYGVLSGPTFARELASGKPTAAVLACDAKESLLSKSQQAFSNASLRIYTSRDVIGVELGGCLKNIYAIAAGLCNGLQLGDNAKAALLPRALKEMIQLGTALGGCTKTFYGLSGLGDLVATCNGQGSRNRTLGQKWAESPKPTHLIASGKEVVEGYGATACFFQLCQKRGLKAPILEEIYRVLYQNKAPSAALGTLMGRTLKAE